MEAEYYSPLSVTCTDDLTPKENLIVSAFSSQEGIVSVYSEGSSLVIQPVSESYGESLIQLSVEDERGNEWADSFRVFVSEVEDSPVFEGLPMSIYVEIGETATLSCRYMIPILKVWWSRVVVRGRFSPMEY